MSRSTLKGETNLRFQPAVVGGFVKAFAVLPAGYLVGKAEVRRCDVSGYRSGVGVVEEVAHGHPNTQVIAARRGGGSDEAAQAAAGGCRHRVAARTGARGIA